MKYKLMMALLLLGSVFSFAQTEDELKSLAIAQAKETSQAMLDQDYKTIVKYTHSNIADMMGGKDKMLTTIEASMSGMEEAGVSFDKSEIGELLAFKKEDGEYRCLIESYLVMTMKLQKKRISKKSSLFGFYDAEAKHWTFVEANSISGPAGKQFFPDFKTNIEIPEDEQTIEDL